MSIESWIGIISGVIGIVMSCIALYHWLKKRPIVDLMKQLTDGSLSTEKHRKILRKINVRLLPLGKQISPEYINEFVLGNRGKEAIFTDICLKNDIEPTEEICMKFMGGNYPTIRQKYHQMKQGEGKKVSKVVEDKENKTQSGEIVYVSELLEQHFPNVFTSLTTLLQKYDVEYRLLKGTKDIWCKDYMPIQTKSGKLIQFRYDPSYLKGKKEWEESRSDVKEVCKQNGFTPVYSNINLDGGNVLLCDDRVIISDRVFTENPEYDNKERLIKEISNLLEAEVIVISAQNGDYTGHVDGMVRFVDRNTILGNKLTDEYKYWSTGMEKVIKQYNLKPVG